MTTVPEQSNNPLGFVILSGYPFPFLLRGRQFALTFIAFWGLVLFFWTLNKYTCTRCVNFSCPLNRTPKAFRDEYLRRNPTMRKAWEASGRRLGKEGERKP